MLGRYTLEPLPKSPKNVLMIARFGRFLCGETLAATPGSRNLIVDRVRLGGVCRLRPNPALVLI